MGARLPVGSNQPYAPILCNRLRSAHRGVPWHQSFRAPWTAGVSAVSCRPKAMARRARLCSPYSQISFCNLTQMNLVRYRHVFPLA